MRAFYNCKSLKQITLPPKITEWYEESFAYSGLESVCFEEGLEIIGGLAFAHTNIKSIVLPTSIKMIGDGAFGDNPELESVSLNNGLITIGNSAFGGQTKLTEIVIPHTVKNITEFAFNGAHQLQKVMFEGDAPATYLVEGTEKANYIIYFHKGAEGFTSPEWYGYPTEIW